MQHRAENAADEARQLAADMIDGCLGVRVGRLHRLVAREFEHQLRPLGLSLQQLEALATLTACAGPVKPSLVADLLAVDRSTMSRNLAVLVDRGWVRGTDVSDSGRSLTVEITTAGTARLAQARGAWATAQATLKGRLDGAAAATLDTWLAALSSPAPRSLR